MFVRIEYWNPMLGDWAVGHAGTELKDPSEYLRKLTKRRVVARALDLDSGEIFYTDGSNLL